jgi:hypothetical protein
VYDTKQPEGREKPRELPFRLLVLGDVGGDKSAPLDQRKVRQLNGRNLGEVIKGLKVEVRDIDLGDVGGKPRPKMRVLIDSISSFAPDDVLELLTGQKAKRASVDPMLAGAWGADKTPKDLWPGDEALTARWSEREQVTGFQKSYQNSKTLRAALKRFSAPPADAAETQARKDAIAKMKTEIASALSASSKPTT